jgi:hypothetical protein
MLLTQAARYFDRLPMVDSYSPGSTLFKCQFDQYDDSKQDGSTVERRIMSVAPGTTIPTRRAIRGGGLDWIVGDLSPDFFKSTAIRHKYILHRSEGLSDICTPAQLLANTVGFSAHTSRTWVKGNNETDESSGVFNVYNLYFAAGEPVTRLHIVKVGSSYYLVRETYGVTAGFHVAVCDELEPPVTETVLYGSRTYDPVAETYTGATPSIKVLRVRWQSKFDYLSRGTEKFMSGDDVVVALQSAITPKPGDKIPLSDGDRAVLSAYAQGGCWYIHARPM